MLCYTRLHGLHEMIHISLTIYGLKPPADPFQEHGFFVSSTDRQRRLHFRSPHWRRVARLFVALDGVHRLNKAN